MQASEVTTQNQANDSTAKDKSFSAYKTPAEWAALYGRSNWEIFPVHGVKDGKCTCGKPTCTTPGKHPQTANGHLDATADAETIKEWWRTWPEANIGYRPAEDEIVIDLEAEGIKSGSFDKLEKKLGKLPAGRRTITGGGGRHLFFLIPEGTPEIRNRTKPLPDIDIRTHKGFVILPPSNHASGNNYAWNKNTGMEKPVLPDQWVKAILEGQDRKKGKKNARTTTKYTTGSRNEDLFTMACAARGKGKNRDEITEELIDYNQRMVKPPAELDEIDKIVNSAMRYEPNAETATLNDVDYQAEEEDRGHAEVLYPYFLGFQRWAEHTGKWMRWTGQLWEEDTEQRVAYVASRSLEMEYKERAMNSNKKEAGTWLREAKTVKNYSRIKGALNFLKGMPKISTKADDWDSNGWELNVQNGIIDLHTGELRERTSADLVSKIVMAEYNQDATCPKWSTHIETILQDPEIQRQVQRDLGRALLGVVVREGFSIWYGEGANGKTTTIRVMAALMGKYLKYTAPGILIAKKHDQHPTEWADLANSRFAICSEVEQGKRLAEALVKDRTGGETKKARFMREDFFDMKQTFDIFLLANYKPMIMGRDTGIWRRINIIPFTHTIPPTQQRPQDEIVSELAAEGSGILNWLLAGLKDSLKNLKWEATACKEARQDYRAEQDKLAPFITEKCQVDKRKEILFSVLYKHYCIHCGINDTNPMSKPEFSYALSGNGYKTMKKGHGKNLYVIGLWTNGETQLTSHELDEEQEGE